MDVADAPQVAEHPDDLVGREVGPLDVDVEVVVRRALPLDVTRFAPPLVGQPPQVLDGVPAALARYSLLTTSHRSRPGPYAQNWTYRPAPESSSHASSHGERSRSAESRASHRASEAENEDQRSSGVAVALMTCPANLAPTSARARSSARMTRRHELSDRRWTSCTSP